MRHTISDVDWVRIKGFLPKRGPHANNRTFINAILWIARTGSPWRDLPGRFGHWNSVWRRFRRWAEAGLWGRILAEVRDPDVSTLILDSTTIRAQASAAGASKKKPASPRPQPRRLRHQDPLQPEPPGPSAGPEADARPGR